MKGKKGTAGDWGGVFLFYIFLALIFLFITFFIKPTFGGSKEIEIKAEVENKVKDIALFALLNAEVNGKTLAGIITAQSGYDSGAIKSSIESSLKAVSQEPLFEVYINGQLVTRNCPSKCRSSSLKDEYEILLPKRHSEPVVFKLKVYSK